MKAYRSSSGGATDGASYKLTYKRRTHSRRAMTSRQRTYSASCGSSLLIDDSEALTLSPHARRRDRCAV